MLINTREVIKYNNKKYVVFIDPETDREEFIETNNIEEKYHYF